MVDDIEDIFKKNRFIVEEDVAITGYSGVEHRFSILLSNGDNKIVVEFSDGSNIELDIFRLSIKCRDVDIHHAILVLNRNMSISDKISRMAEENGIRIVKSSNIRDNGRAG